jgi:hypothetical protein
MSYISALAIILDITMLSVFGKDENLWRSSFSMHFHPASCSLLLLRISVLLRTVFC